MHVPCDSRANDGVQMLAASETAVDLTFMGMDFRGVGCILLLGPLVASTKFLSMFCCKAREVNGL